MEPDWSFQDDAVSSCLSSLSKSVDQKVGLVVPTGGGKTRIAIRTILLWLRDHSKRQAVWFTHRTTLREQVQQELQDMITEGLTGIPAEEATTLAKRIEVYMVSDIESRLGTPPSDQLLVIVDEAHHAAAPSYGPLFETPYPVNGLFLTATPNRTDNLPIGIDEIAFSITHKQLEERNVILRPTFETIDVSSFEIGEDLAEKYAHYIAKRTKSDFTKCLVLASRVEAVERIYNHLVQLVKEDASHPLDPEDIGFVHGSARSYGTDQKTFLEHFRAKPRAVYVSAQVLLEGFNDPAIDSVVLTYASQSVIQLVQAVGRCVRYSAKKKKAIVVQARNSSLSYYFDHRWLYQEISDLLRPQLVDRVYSSKAQLFQEVEAILSAHNVGKERRHAILSQLNDTTPGDRVRILLSGLPFYQGDFNTAATWSAVLEDESTSERVRSIFNDFCARCGEAGDAELFARKYAQEHAIPQDPSPGSAFRAYVSLLQAMIFSSRELATDTSESEYHPQRGYTRHGATTWLKYATFIYHAAAPSELVSFLGEAWNKDAVLTEFEKDPSSFAGALCVPLPGSMYEACVLTKDAAAQLTNFISEAESALQSAEPASRIKMLETLAESHQVLAYVPATYAQYLWMLVRPEERAKHLLLLTS